ncbi:tRNA threonylcarbamoyladenosine dehydratase [Thiomicrospira sp. S5]|jgi:tRNA A37 threonylcarbamoyladenosine dehydratase|uniref:tRNA threonylcarbamoyladenosine dehydratase n=1 Tax=Thiomicrospira sp. S5 TaxID=1803865 RepID=UPI000F89EF26|nr:tRNA threonylcarbamoyladenosine dehydratase [Thiomicrospira sp. S5]AZR82859.1 tRNA threonylcarbamoyladenosine dehydratase [Thiomicrospira sp. S5]
MEALFERSRLVFDDEGIERLKGSHVLVAGVGGVGGFVIEALARAGVGRLTIVDHDQVSPSNLNRQIIALESTLGKNKALVMQARIQDINPECEVVTIQRFLKPDDMDELLQSDFDYVVDAIDSLNCKVALVATAFQKGFKVVSSMGAGRRVDPSKIQITDVSKTHTCGLARNMRQRLKKQRIHKGITVVFSTELPKDPGPMEEIEGARGRVVNGTASYMPGLFGLMLAGVVIKDLAG